MPLSAHGHWISRWTRVGSGSSATSSESGLSTRASSSSSLQSEELERELQAYLEGVIEGEEIEVAAGSREPEFSS